MNYKNLKSNISKIEKYKVKIIKYWIGNIDILTILKKKDIHIETFVRDYALGVVNYYISVVNGENSVGNCPTMLRLIHYLKEKGITSSEIFVLCNGFKNALVKLSFDLKISNFELLREIEFIYERNFKEILEELSQSTEKIQKRLDKKSDIIDKYIILSKIGKKGKILDVSEAFCDISGYTKNELLEDSNTILRHMDMPDEFYDDFWETINSGNSWHGEIKNLKKDKTTYWVDVRISPRYDSEGNFLYFDSISQDITSKKKLEEQQDILIEQSKLAAMGEMISMIAHQWRQPLQAVSILVQKLTITKSLDGKVPDELIDSTVDDVMRHLDYMSKTIDDFRDFFLPNKIKEKVDIQSLVEKALDFISFMIKKDSISVEIDNNSDKKVKVFVNEIVQVIINILKNARDILVERDIKERDIKIRFYEIENFVCIEIEDNAGGIDEEIKDKIFEPYFSTKDDKNGTGLGLYMSKTIIEKHSQGRLSVENSDRGAKFIIRLPLN